MDDIKVDRDLRISTVGRDDYPEIEGKIVSYFTGERYLNGIVVGCNRSVGLTIVKVEDKDTYLICLRGKVAPNGQTPFDDKACTYDVYFDALIAAIKTGELNAPALYKIHSPRYSEWDCAPNGASCAYGQ